MTPRAMPQPAMTQQPATAPMFDPFDPAHLADPYPGYRLLRETDPVHHHRGDGTTAHPDFWALSRYADVDAAVCDPGTFSSASGLTFYRDEIEKLGLAPTIVMMDPPEHSGKRRLLAKAFSPKRVAATEPRIRDFVRGRLAEMAERYDDEVVDLHRDFSAQIPTFVLAHLFDLPTADRPLFGPWVSALTTLQEEGFRPAGLEGGAVDAVAEMFAYFGELIAERRAHPGDDLISALAQAEIEGERLDDWDILGFCFVIVAGGNDTTGNLISHTVALLDSHPRQREMLVADPGLIPGALSECLRFESSVQALARTTTREVTVGGTTIPVGEKVMMLYGSANRDEREFGPTAGQLDITREISGHLGFARGPHFCIGSHFARLQARIAVEELYAAHPTVGVDRGSAVRALSPFTRGFVSLPATGLA
ncbi:cytochrome P450 [Dietzia kunjamensis]|uniref:cytochrome P450 n=1 Tax=Dietzia kunjamensis TaxID=322509 RepID=UPI0022B3C409|nr:cytochrome P450 [Dietzia kunjamensis]MCZ4656054.1 cytochrome P450 [Dietzia kunjamensis]MDJ0422701.1 cytochrome P450 [Dietzia kunjamensis]